MTVRADFAASVGDFRLEVAFEAENELVVLYGRSGSGKSVTLRALAGLVRPESGRIEIGGRAVFDAAAGLELPPQQRRVGYVIQELALFPHLSMRQNVLIGLEHDREAPARYEALRALLSIEGLDERRPHELSGGQQQRVALARALVRPSDVLLLDEPFSALDEALRSDLRSELLRLRREIELPIVFVTHDLREAHLLADRIAVIDEGRAAAVRRARRGVPPPLQPARGGADRHREYLPRRGARRERGPRRAGAAGRRPRCGRGRGGGRRDSRRALHPAARPIRTARCRRTASLRSWSGGPGIRQHAHAAAGAGGRRAGGGGRGGVAAVRGAGDRPPAALGGGAAGGRPARDAERPRGLDAAGAGSGPVCSKESAAKERGGESSTIEAGQGAGRPLARVPFGLRARGKSELRWTGCRLTAGRREPTESATETYRRRGLRA